MSIFKKFRLSLFKLFLTIILIVLAVILIVKWQHQPKSPIETISREGVIQKVQTLNRLQTVVYHVDTVITSQKQGNWYTLWQDEQKGLFVAHGQVQAGIDLNLLQPEQVQVLDNGKQVMITLPAAEVFSVFLDNIEVYDIKTGLFGILDIDPQLFQQAQAVGKKQVLETACRSDMLTLATENAQKQIQTLFGLADIQVTVLTTPAKPCVYKI